MVQFVTDRAAAVSFNPARQANPFPPEPVGLVTDIANQTVRYSAQALTASRFFGRLSEGAYDLTTLQAVFTQYRHWRDQFHTWFGLCILKSGSCYEAGVVDTVMALAEHAFEELRDDHAGMYLDFLTRIGVNRKAALSVPKSAATRVYERSFLEAFGIGRANFREAVIALSGRELFASVRNGFVIENLSQQLPQIRDAAWWTVHQELEVEHFHKAIAPFISHGAGTREAENMLDLMRAEIDRHIGYWDALLAEAIDASNR